MTDPEKRELARKVTVLYDGIGMLMGRLQETGRLTKAEEELGRAVWNTWREMLRSLGMCSTEAVQELRGGGEWPEDIFSESGGWTNFLKGLQ